MTSSLVSLTFIFLNSLPMRALPRLTLTPMGIRELPDLGNIRRVYIVVGHGRARGQLRLLNMGEVSSSHRIHRFQFTSFRMDAIRRAVSTKCCTSPGSSDLPNTLRSRYDSHFLSTW